MAAIAIVTGCANCPCCATEVANWGLQDEQSICRHPDGKLREVSKRRNQDKPAKAPRWCPLRVGALEIHLVASPATATKKEGG